MNRFGRWTTLAASVVLCSQALGQIAATQNAPVTTKPAVQAPDTVVATLGANKLTRGELDSIKKFFAPNAPASVDDQIIDNWKIVTVLYEEAKKANVETDPDAKVVLEFLKKQNDSRIYLQLQQMKVTVTDEEAQKFYTENSDKPEFRKGFYITAKIIAAPAKEDIDALKAEIAKGKTFDELFEANKAKTKELTGLADPDLKNVASNLLVTNLGQGVVSAMNYVKENDVVGPRNFTKGWILFRITERKPGELTPFDQVKEEIKTRLQREKQMTIQREIIEKAQNIAGVKPPQRPMPMMKPTTRPAKPGMKSMIKPVIKPNTTK
jgi:parvulin-like peptidyl-prolyl isomerase